jgi:hypothetical protein
MLPYNGRPGERHRGGTSTLYVIAGFGFYNVHSAVGPFNNPGNGSLTYEMQTRAFTGWNVGGGLRIPVGAASVYVEARVHMMNAAGPRVVPLTIGFVF